MTSVALVDVRPPKLVEVLADGVWHPGELEAWRAQDGRWRGYVRWTVGVGMRHMTSDVQRVPNGLRERERGTMVTYAGVIHGHRSRRESAVLHRGSRFHARNGRGVRQ